MHACQLVELAAMVSIHGPLLVRSDRRISPSGLEQYWSTSKIRLDRWARDMKRSAAPREAADAARPAHGETSQLAIIEEVLTSEVLTRLWTAILTAHDRQRGTSEAEPIARSVLIGHMEARHRVLKLIGGGPGLAVEDAIRANRLRRRTERWTDVLIARLPASHDLSELASYPERARELVSEFAGEHHMVWPMMMASLRVAFRNPLCAESPNSDLNARIASSILACFPPEVFDSTGVLPSAWLLRLLNTTEDAQGLIRELFEDEQRPAAARLDRTSPPDGIHHLRRRGLDDPW